MYSYPTILYLSPLLWYETRNHASKTVQPSSIRTPQKQLLFIPQIILSKSYFIRKNTEFHFNYEATVSDCERYWQGYTAWFCLNTGRCYDFSPPRLGPCRSCHPPFWVSMCATLLQVGQSHDHVLVGNGGAAFCSYKNQIKYQLKWCCFFFISRGGSNCSLEGSMFVLPLCYRNITEEEIRAH